MPSRADFQPRETVRFLPLISLIDVLEDGRDYRFRLVGSAVEAMLQTSLTGLKLSEYPHRESAEIMQRMYGIV
ncbi:MAG: PAS domain-containing protein, partial [Sphingomonadales bacterium]